jgi:pyridoxamine 5'-phosphate oxidase-like protein
MTMDTITTMPTPKRDRPQLPTGYISRAPKGMLTWTAVQRILKTFPYLWIATVNADGRPHLVQQWGVWVNGTLYFEGSDRTRWARNLARDPRLGFGMENGHRAVYGEALVDVVRGVDRKLATQIARQYATKYGRGFKYRPKAEQYEKGHVFRARPEKLIAFDVKKFESSAARFTFR